MTRRALLAMLLALGAVPAGGCDPKPKPKPVTSTTARPTRATPPAKPVDPQRSPPAKKKHATHEHPHGAHPHGAHPHHHHPHPHPHLDGADGHHHPY